MQKIHYEIKEFSGKVTLTLEIENDNDILNETANMDNVHVKLFMILLFLQIFKEKLTEEYMREAFLFHQTIFSVFKLSHLHVISLHLWQSSKWSIGHRIINHSFKSKSILAYHNGIKYTRLKRNLYRVIILLVFSCSVMSNCLRPHGL